MRLRAKRREQGTKRDGRVMGHMGPNAPPQGGWGVIFLHFLGAFVKIPRGELLRLCLICGILYMFIGEKGV